MEAKTLGASNLGRQSQSMVPSTPTRAACAGLLLPRGLLSGGTPRASPWTRTVLPMRALLLLTVADNDRSGQCGSLRSRRVGSRDQEKHPLLLTSPPSRGSGQEG